MVFLPFVETSSAIGFKVLLVAGAVAGSCDLLGGVGVDDVGGDQCFGLFQTGQ